MLHGKALSNAPENAMLQWWREYKKTPKRQSCRDRARQAPLELDEVSMFYEAPPARSVSFNKAAVLSRQVIHPHYRNRLLPMLSCSEGGAQRDNSASLPPAKNLTFCFCLGGIHGEKYTHRKTNLPFPQVLAKDQAMPQKSTIASQRSRGCLLRGCFRAILKPFRPSGSQTKSH